MIDDGKVAARYHRSTAITTSLVPEASDGSVGPFGPPPAPNGDERPPSFLEAKEHNR